MVFCCDEEEHELFHPLTNSTNHHQNLMESSSSTSSATVHEGDITVISPMNSNFYALVCSDTLRSILERLQIADLARAACVSRLWRAIASDREMQKKAFKAPWNLKDVIGNPSSGIFWRDNSLSKFAISHCLVRGDSVTSLAVKYSVQVTGIKRLNNMMSDHGIYSRERLLIPVSNPALLINGTCYIEVDTHAKREVAVPGRKVNGPLNRLTTERGKRRVIDSLKRSMHVDDGTAQYYLSLSNGDPRNAISQLSDDLKWEMQVGFA